jgi:hypothetical protein
MDYSVALPEIQPRRVHFYMRNARTGGWPLFGLALALMAVPLVDMGRQLRQGQSG